MTQPTASKHWRKPVGHWDRLKGATKVRMSFEVDLSVCWPVSESRRQSSATYGGSTLVDDWWTSPGTLKMTRWWTGSQCNCCSNGVAWSRQWAPITRVLHAVCTDCWRWSSPSPTPYSSELQHSRRHETNGWTRVLVACTDSVRTTGWSWHSWL